MCGLVFALLLSACAVTQNNQPAMVRLGDVDFPTSARSVAAQQQFERGVAALHSFWYPMARDSFRHAQAIEPSFAMAYWGEAMTYNHPVWGDPQNTEAGRAAVARIPAQAEVSLRERAYLNAVRALYGEGDKRVRDAKYLDVMQQLHQHFPADKEGKLFYALALLGTGDEALRLQAGAVAMEVFEAHPNHPGAAHYVIHAYDDPKHARLALPAAQRYADIAPDAAHALHMPSHIFLQLGMWPEAARSNERAWRASLDWVREHAADSSTPDYHSLHWLLYVYLQQGRYEPAYALLETLRKVRAAHPQGDMQMRVYATYLQATMGATWLIETQNWQRAEAVLQGLSAAEKSVQPGFLALAVSPATFARGMAAAHTGSFTAAMLASEQLRQLKAPLQAAQIPYVAGIVAAAHIQAQMIEAVAAAARKDFARAQQLAQAAVGAVEQLPPPVGPPQLIKPPHELLADIALAAGEPVQAQANYRIALDRHENRALALIGAARAADANGDSAQAKRWLAILDQQWEGPQLAQANR